MIVEFIGEVAFEAIALLWELLGEVRSSDVDSRSRLTELHLNGIR